MAHSIDLHAALVPPNLNFTPVLPGQSHTIHFVASVPGAFMYHCESSLMALHIAQGMYGAVVVTPPGQTPPLYTLVQSEFYRADSLQSVMTGQPRYTVFNGLAYRYATTPLVAPVDKPFNIAVVNAVHASGNPRNNLYDVQTYPIAPGDGAVIQLEFMVPGQYSFVSHIMKQMNQGDRGVFGAATRDGTSAGNSK